MEFNLKRILRALLLSTSEPISVKDIQDLITRYHEEADGDEVVTEAEETGEIETQQMFGPIVSQVPSMVTATQIREAMEEMANELLEKNDVWRILQRADGYVMTISPEFGEWVRLLRGEAKPKRLSPAAMETLAIVAYRQPVTRAELEAIRGVSADNALSRLMDFELVYITGRADLPGRPLQYGTTEKFLTFCGLRSLEELPASDVLSVSQLNEWVRQASQPRKEIKDEDVGLAQEELFRNDEG